MSKKLFVGGISWNTSEAGLREAFEQFGEVVEATIVVDRDTGRSRGFGFVVFADDGDALKAVEALNGTELDGRSIRVDEARERSRDDRGGVAAGTAAAVGIVAGSEPGSGQLCGSPESPASPTAGSKEKRATTTVTLSGPPRSSARSTRDRQATSGDFIRPRISAISSSSTTSVRPSVQSSSRSSSGQAEAVDVHVRQFRVSAEHVRQDVAQSMGRCLFVGDGPGVHQHLYVSVVPSQLLQSSVAKQVGPRVAGVGDEQVPAHAVDDRHRRAHSAQFRFGFDAFGQGRIDLPIVADRATHQLVGAVVVELHDPVRDIQDDVDQRADGHAAGHLARRRPAHAVGDHHHVAGFVETVGHLSVGQAGDQRVE